MSGGRRTALGLCYALATFLAFPQPVAGGVVDLGTSLAWLPPALLILMLRDLPPRRAAAAGFAASLAAHTAVIHWIYVVTVVYGNAPVGVGLIAPVLLACWCALFAGLFGAGWSVLARHGLDSPLAAALLWTALDRVRGLEFPWATLGYAQHQSPALLPLAAFGGVYALSFVTVLGGAGLAALAAGRRRQAGLALAGVALAHAAGLLAPDPGPPAGAETLRVAVLQGNIDQGVKWSRRYADETLAIYESLTREAAAAGASVVVWPETAVPGALEASPSMLERVASLARETGVELVVGGVGLELDASGRPLRFFDSGFVFSRDGEVTDRYDKAHLVPFGEYVPFRPLLGLFVNAVASGVAALDVSAGAGPRSVDLESGGSVRAGVVVCYELLFPHLVRRFALDGAELLLAITNDAWYGRTGAPHQFLAITALRSAETGLFTARAANTGVSGFIDGRGRVLERTPIFERAWRLMDVPRHPDPTRATFYVRRGDVFAWSCVAGSAAWLFTAARRARGARMGNAPASPARGPG